MKFTPEVIAALATLRANAENDFERHRIDVLERDLTAPPVVEVIDDKHQRFNGVTYTQHGAGHFVKRELGIHREVWQYHYGGIPEGYEIHHVDQNKAHNEISNLQCLTKSEHHKIHLPKGTRLNNKQESYICEVCGQPFIARKTGRPQYCSERCRRNKAKQNETFTEHTCEVCGKKFSARRGKKQRCCSISCGVKLANHEQQIIRKCVVCGTIFTTAKNSNKKYCSRKCSLKAWRKSHQKS